jgi:hypothetical protein
MAELFAIEVPDDLASEVSEKANPGTERLVGRPGAALTEPGIRAPPRCTE